MVPSGESNYPLSFRMKTLIQDLDSYEKNGWFTKEQSIEVLQQAYIVESKRLELWTRYPGKAVGAANGKIFIYDTAREFEQFVPRMFYYESPILAPGE